MKPEERAQEIFRGMKIGEDTIIGDAAKVGGRLVDRITEQIRAAEADAYRRGQEAMKRRAEKVAYENGMVSIADPRMPATVGGDISVAIRSLPIEEEKR